MPSGAGRWGKANFALTEFAEVRQEFIGNSPRIASMPEQDVEYKPALRVERGLRPIPDDLTSGLPEGYHLDLLSDPCVITLRRPAGTVVARFTPFADPKEIRQAAEEDRARVEAESDG